MTAIVWVVEMLVDDKWEPTRGAGIGFSDAQQEKQLRAELRVANETGRAAAKALQAKDILLRIRRVEEFTKRHCESSYVSSPDLDCVIIREVIECALAALPDSWKDAQTENGE